MNKKTTKGTNVDTPQMEQMRTQVVEQELSARSWKAYYEKMYYSMEAEKLEPAYKEYSERMQKRREEEKKAYEEFIKTMQESMTKINEENPLGNVEVQEKETPVIQM